METYIFQHVEYEGPGAILPYLQAKGHNVHIVRLYAGDPIPHEDDVDFAILMGGPMSVLDETKYPHFVREKELCCDMVQLGKPLLGICLGAQMIASAFGAAIKTAVSQGAKRGLFSNEAGMGSTPHAHAQANVEHPMIRVLLL